MSLIEEVKCKALLKLPLIQGYTYDELCNMDTLYMGNKLYTYDLSNLKYLPPNITIKISYKNKSTLKIINRLNELGYNNKVVLTYSLNDQEKLNNFIIDSNIVGNNIYIGTLFQDRNVFEYLKYEKRLYEMLRPTVNLSPFEKYIYIYNLVKNYKQYNENTEDLLDSRDIYRVLDNEYMTCTGYALLFNNLLNKVGINNMVYRKEVIDIGDDHLRNFVHIVDNKYGIDGFYCSDTTYDNNLAIDSYDFLVLTNIEEVDVSNEYLINDEEYLFTAKDQEDFITKYRNVRKDNPDIPKSLVHILNNLDPKTSNEFKKKYRELKHDEAYSETLFNMANYFIGHINKKIPSHTIEFALREVLKKAYCLNQEEINRKIKEIKLTDVIKKKKTL